MTKIIRFYGTSWCSDCKRAKKFLAEHRISYPWIDIEENEEAAKRVEEINDGKRKVPTIEFDDGSFLIVPSNAELAEKLDLVTELSHTFHDIVIIGGGPAGLTCALYTAREGFDTVVIEKGSLGGQISFTDKIDNFPGFPEGIAGEELAERIVQQAERFNVEFLKATEVTKVYQEKGYLIAKTGHGDEITAKVMVIATGSRYKKLEIEGEDDLLGYKIHYCSVCDGPFYKDKEVIVIGGGNSAFEESQFLARFASKVTIVGHSDTWKASKVLQQKVSELDKIRLVKNCEAKEFLVGPNKTLKGVKFYHQKSKEDKILEADGVFIFIGLTPNIEPVKELVETDKGGFIKTTNTLMTKTHGLFAAGDCRSGSVQQAASAAGEGAAVAVMIRNFLKSH